MGVRITSVEGVHALYCSTSDWAFGPVFYNAGDAESFLAFFDTATDRDPRLLTDNELQAIHSAWMEVRESFGSES